MTYEEQLAAWEAEDAAELACGRARTAYYAFVATLLEKESATGLYLTDENVDDENSCHEERGSLDYWQAMLRSAEMAADMRAEEAGVAL